MNKSAGKNDSKGLLYGLAVGAFGLFLLTRGDPATPVVPSHTVVDGETLGSIALEVWGDAGLWPLLWSSNQRVLGAYPGVLAPGQVLAVPPLASFRAEDIAAARLQAQTSAP